MTNNDVLLTLILSLTKSEKKYIKTTLSSNKRNGESNLLNLYIIIELLTNKKNIITNKYLSELSGINHINSTKKQLKDVILKSLRSYNDNKKSRWKIDNYKKNCEIFLSKRLPKEALKEASKAILLAKKHENHLMISQLEILKLECHKQIFKPKKLESQIIECYNNIEDSIDNFSEFINKKRGYEIIRADLKINGISRTTNDKDKRTSKFKELSINFSNSSLRSSKFMLENMKGIYYFSIGQFEESYQSSKKSLSILEENPHEKSEHDSQYLISTYNLIVGAYYTNREKEIHKHLNTLKCYNVNEFSAYLFKIERYYNIAFNLYMSSFNLDKLSELVTEFQKIYTLVENHIEKEFRLLLLGQCANIFLFLRDHKSCKKWNNFLLNSHHHYVRGDILATAMMRDLIITWDQKKHDLLIHKLNNVRQRLKSRNKLHNAELLIIKAIYKTIDENIKSPNIFILNKVNEIFKEDNNKRILDQFDYVKFFELASKR